ncbi:MAG: carboxylating nicotinate-nucleotide diphosphorylase [Chromatiales bacterium]|jgi:nicotinate-nucleotide pyrophosphorylase (carboxylating)|nr:carboxylating nicotinate-nucleotide diphosphorylase [Chromatiales bacterium]
MPTIADPKPLSTETVREDIVRALAEDLGEGDPTAALVGESVQACATVIAREPAVLCGTAWFEMAFQAFDANATISWEASDGDAIAAEQRICTISGTARALLSAERTALNLLQTLSGTATTAHRYRERIADLPVTLLDTRKTIPGLRSAQKYAIRCGGASNHRMGLYDAILIKENHLAMFDSLSAAFNAARELFPKLSVEIEVEHLHQLEEALTAGVDIVLLDNFTVQAMREAVALRNNRNSKTLLEASGGITLDNIRAVAETGVNRIAIGALTKDLRAIDLSMRMEMVG